MLYCLSLPEILTELRNTFFFLCSAANWSQPSEIEGGFEIWSDSNGQIRVCAAAEYMKLFLHRKISCMTTTLGWMQLVIEIAIFFLVPSTIYFIPIHFSQSDKWLMTTTSQWMRNNGKCFIQSQMQIVWFFLSQISSSSCLFVLFQHFIELFCCDFCMHKLHKNIKNFSSTST